VAHSVGVNLPVDYAPYSPDHLSYMVFIAAPFHKNESKNLSDKFDSAFANAEKHAKQKGDGVRAVLLRVPETISLKTCDAWAKAYLASNANSPIDFSYTKSPWNSPMIKASLVTQCPYPQPPGSKLGKRPTIRAAT